MYLTAHIVRDSAGNEAMNSFRHWHGSNFAWPVDASTLPDTNPGQLDENAMSIGLRPGGNRVRAYLDVLAPDNTSMEELDEALSTLLGDLSQRHNPTVFSVGRVTVRFGVEIALEERRHHTFEELHKEVRRLARLPRSMRKVSKRTNRPKL